MISLGKIVKVRGNRGEVVIPHSPKGNISIPKTGEPVLLKSSKYQKTFEVEYYKEISGAFVLKLKNIDKINDALKLVGYTVFVFSALREQPEQKGMTGFTVKDVTGDTWGEIIHVETGSGIDLMEIRDRDDEVIYVPFTEGIIKEIDEEKRIVVIDPPDGLRELNK